jgi:hypothetical protein
MTKLPFLPYRIPQPRFADSLPILEGAPPGHDQNEQFGCRRTGWAELAGQLHPISQSNVLEANVEFL